MEKSIRQYNLYACLTVHKLHYMAPLMPQIASFDNLDGAVSALYGHPTFYCVVT
jgi:hypothetical protein